MSSSERGRHRARPAGGGCENAAGGRRAHLPADSSGCSSAPGSRGTAACSTGPAEMRSGRGSSSVTPTTSGASRVRSATSPATDTVSGTGSVTSVRSETTRAWQAWIMSLPSSVPPNTLPSTSRTRQAPQTPLRQSCGRSTPFMSALSSRRSPHIGVEGLLVDGHLADLRHHSTSRRIGRTCRVCLIWL